MICDLEDADIPRFEKPDICIIGAGAAGIVLAVELLRQGMRVLMLEGGGREIEERSQEPYASEIAGRPHNGIHTGRFRAYGGTTTRWGGQVLELDGVDFERRSWIPGSGWPFPKTELTRYYKRAMELEGLGNATASDEAVWREIGMQKPRFGDDLEPYFSRWCPEPNFAYLHRRVLEGSEHIAIYLHANVCGIISDEAGQRVSSVRCRTLDGRETLFSARQYVFCMGAIESARFFLQPEVGRATSANVTGLVGRHFQDHIDCNAASITITDAKRFHALFDNVFSRGYKYHPKLKLAARAAEQNSTLNAAGTMQFLTEIDELLASLKATAKKILHGGVREAGLAGLLNISSHLPLILRQAIRYKFQHRVYNPGSARIFLRVHCEQEPLSPSMITLSEQRDSLGLLRARLEWKISPLELKTIRFFAESVRRTLAEQNVAILELDAELATESPRFAEKCDDSNHHMGGMRMDPSPLRGVVDTDLKIHGNENCYVCSSAVFPTSGFSNPTHTLLALAMRLAEHLTALPREG